MSEMEKLSLQLDHINGVNDDNRLENLRILCGRVTHKIKHIVRKIKNNMKLLKEMAQ